MALWGWQVPESRVSIIQSVQTPLGFFTLVVLVAEVILGGLATQAAGVDFTLLIVGMLGLLFALIWAVLRLAKGAPAAHRSPARKRYDVFLSSVLAGFSDDARLLVEKKSAMAIAGTLERECHFTVYYAGREVNSLDDFDGSQIGPSDDLEALRGSRYFLMLYPARITSSVLFEAGLALEYCESSLYVVRNNDDLPYLMRRLPETNPQVRIIIARTTESVQRLIQRHREKLFDRPVPD
jgi:hypothetical protein